MLERLNVVRSSSATLAGDAVVVGDPLSDATFIRSGARGGRYGDRQCPKDAIIQYDDGTPRTKHRTTSCAIEVDEAAGGWFARRPAIIHDSLMTDNLDNLILDLLEWLGSSQRPYLEVLDAWRTSCPRFPVWEDANDRGFIERHYAPGRGQYVSVSVAGIEHLRKYRSQRVTDVEPLSV